MMSRRNFLVALSFCAIFFAGFAGRVQLASAYAFGHDLRYGDTLTDVASLQRYLQGQGFFHHVITRYYGKVTFVAVRDWQGVNGIPATGFFGPISRAFVNGNGVPKPMALATSSADQGGTLAPATSSSSSVGTRATPPPVTPVPPVGAVGLAPASARPIVSIAISPTTATLNSAATTTFSASLTNASDPSVTWSASLGTVSSSGVYTAPTVFVTKTDTVTATANADTSKSAAATVTVNPLAISMSVSPSSTSLTATATTTFTATVTNASTSAVTWSASLGTIDASGIYTPPGGVTSSITDTITATSIASSSHSATATISVVNGLLGWWPLNEGSGTVAVDKSGNGHNGTWNGTQAGSSGYYSQGINSSTLAGNFNGSDDYVSISGLTSAGNLKTVTFWAYLSSAAIADTEEIVSKSSPGQGWEVITSGNLAFYVMGSSVVNANVSGSTLASISAQPSWYYITATQDGPGSTMNLYVNGTLQSSSTAPASIGDTSNMTFGKWSGGSGRFFNGEISDVRIYNRILPPSEVNNLYQSVR